MVAAVGVSERFDGWPFGAVTATLGAMTPPNDTHTNDPGGSAAPSRRPLLGSLVVGLLCAYLLNVVVPGMFRLSNVAYLLFYLGLFFFLLYGLLIGAVMFRVGKSARPAPKGLVLTIGIVVVAAIWAGELYQEYRAFPEFAQEQLRKQISGQITPERLDDFRNGVARAIHEHWEANYPPGGFPGFLRWMAKGEPIKCPYVIKEGTHPVPASQQGAGFVFRAVVSLGLLMFSVLSQFMGLALPPPAPESSESTALTGADAPLPASPDSPARSTPD
jgi:hypothetical protein